ncbi:MAG TPA: thiamine phosphate synthase [Oceanipulchritudo sp.]|nr:thiamine phosphate synthase [Oceanipulchritudo sp.]
MSVQHLIRPGFYAILDTCYVDEDEWEYKAESLLAGGACMLQVRAKGHPLERVQELVERVLPAVRKYQVPLIINDHLDLAIKVPEAGLHIGQNDEDILEARRKLGPDRILGLSTHSFEQVEKAIAAIDILSYFTIGPIFATATKADYKPVGTELVSRIAALNASMPFFCIDGINRQNLDQVLAAGATGIAAGSDPLLDPNTEAAVRFYVERLSPTRA